MKKLATRLTIAVLAVIVFVNHGSTVAREPKPPVASASAQPDQATLRWELPADAGPALLLLSGPDGAVTQRQFAAGVVPTLDVRDAAGKLRPDGAYVYELRVQLKAAPGAAAPAAGNGRAAGGPAVGGQSMLLSGSFRILNGALLSGAEEPAPQRPAASGALAGPESPNAPTAPNDQVIPDDLIVQSSICAGFDCADNESFGFDTLRLKENNLRIGFSDTSVSAGFASNDWQITANGDGAGGLDKFSIDDISGGKTPFTIRAGAPTSALYVDSIGRVGLGTAVPSQTLDLTTNDTPAIRFSQTASPWPAYTWEIAGNEANFFVRDVTSGGGLPLRVLDGADHNSLVINGSGNVGLGTENPSARLDVNGNARINGNIQVEGNVIEYSDVNAKENFSAVDGAAVLDRLMEIPILNWNYKADGAAVRHIGPTAQDFYRAFGLGQDNRHIAPLDTNGVALAAVQELHGQAMARDAYIAALEQRLAGAEGRLQSIEERLSALEQK
ncbi:MAG TPA: tail fiber domain-containing protein [Herpetosiphonaceae bacterium]|nr:tail fiber domain-containing protein [Herpetosiphonaceae bacterium]